MLNSCPVRKSKVVRLRLLVHFLVYGCVLARIMAVLTVLWFKFLLTGCAFSQTVVGVWLCCRLNFCCYGYAVAGIVAYVVKLDCSFCGVVCCLNCC